MANQRICSYEAATVHAQSHSRPIRSGRRRYQRRAGTAGRCTGSFPRSSPQTRCLRSVTRRPVSGRDSVAQASLRLRFADLSRHRLRRADGSGQRRSEETATRSQMRDVHIHARRDRQETVRQRRGFCDQDFGGDQVRHQPRRRPEGDQQVHACRRASADAYAGSRLVPLGPRKPGGADAERRGEYRREAVPTASQSR